MTIRCSLTDQEKATTMSLTGILGNRAESLALKYLRKSGLTLVERNFNSRYGEIDIIMQQRDYLVFVEVRYRKNQNFGGALESVDSRKQHKLRRTAEYYLQKNKRTDSPCRFDILCVAGDLKSPNIDWIENAF